VTTLSVNVDDVIQHHKRGTLYAVLEIIESTETEVRDGDILDWVNGKIGSYADVHVQISNTELEDNQWVIYQSMDDPLTFIRPLCEFTTERFALITRGAHESVS
jgi:hypothetical protein